MNDRIGIAKTQQLAIHAILAKIYEKGRITQAEISQSTGFSRSTVSINCEKLLSQQLVKYDNTSSSNKIKNLELELNEDVGFIVGIGMGGTFCRIGLFTVTCKMIAIRKIAVDLEIGPDAILKNITQIINNLIKKEKPKGRLLGIGMGIPSPMKFEDGVAYHPAFMPGWHLYNIKEFFNSIYQCPVFVDNEVNTMALEEYHSLEKRDIKTLLCVKIGTGIGAGLVVRERIYRGENGSAGNLGHICVEESGKPCQCGKTGCIETVASTRAIIENATQLCLADEQSLLCRKYKAEGALTLQMIKECADYGDRIALHVIESAGKSIGNLLGKITTFLDPGIIIITGRATVLGPNFLYYIRDGVFRQSSTWSSPDFQIVFSNLSDNSVAKGAARLCIDELFDRQLLIS
ncbi:MAG: ROK family transcriptional regulator [Spirochaetales bacterium]|nr:ROK family transcriptional regulator [Spirochaetales bacterium]